MKASTFHIPSLFINAGRTAQQEAIRHLSCSPCSSVPPSTRPTTISHRTARVFVTVGRCCESKPRGGFNDISPSRHHFTRLWLPTPFLIATASVFVPAGISCESKPRGGLFFICILLAAHPSVRDCRSPRHARFFPYRCRSSTHAGGCRKTSREGVSVVSLSRHHFTARVAETISHRNRPHIRSTCGHKLREQAARRSLHFSLLAVHPFARNLHSSRRAWFFPYRCRSSTHAGGCWENKPRGGAVVVCYPPAPSSPARERHYYQRKKRIHQAKTQNLL